MNTTIYRHGNITAKNFKTWIITNTRPLFYHRMQGSVAERIKHEAFNILTYREKISNIVTSRYLKINSPWSLIFQS